MMRSLKKLLITVFTAVFLTALIPGSVLADAIYLAGESFYIAHSKEMIAENKDYAANAPSMELKGYQSPEKAEVVEKRKNGMILHVKCKYQDAARIVWGYIEEEKTSFWVPMDYLLTPFTGEMFLEQYAEKIKDVSGAKKESTATDGTWHLFAYPAAAEYTTAEAGEDIGTLTSSYTDEKGNVWNAYRKDSSVVWVLEKDHEAEISSLYPEGAPGIDKRAYREGMGTNEPEIVPSNRSLYKNIFFIMMGVSMAAMVVMAVIVNVGIAKKYKKNK